MVILDETIQFLEQVLDSESFEDYPGAINGLQLANGGEVTRIIAAVDASLPVIEAAAEGGPGLLIVHHGMFWQGARPIVGPLYKKLKIAMDADLAIYSSHLPLDVHPLHGNNMRLAQAVGLQDLNGFFERKGRPMGIKGMWQGDRDALVEAVAHAVGGKVHLCPGGSNKIGKVGVITGAAGSEIEKVARTGVDTLITGEGPHWSYTLALELGMNLIYAGHYRTETHGVKAVAELLAGQFDLPWTFLDHPTGL